MAVLFFSAVGLLSAQRTVVLRDRQDSTGIEGVQLLFRDGSNNIVLAAFTDNRGQCDVGDAILEKSRSLKFQRVGYSTDSIALSASLAFPLVVYLHPSGNLKGVTVDARRSLYKFLPNKLVYQVDRDSSMRDKSSFEALQNMPGLIVTNAGDFKTIDNKTLIFKMNGLRNPLLGGNIKNVLDALPANTLKRIESSTEYGNSSPTLVVNFVTKGQVEGYLAAATNNVGDRQWFSSFYGLTKANRLTIDACYSGTLRYGHPSDSRTTEERESGDVLQLDRFIHAQGVRSYRPSYEVTASYDVDDHSIISVYGRFCHINNERDNETETVSLLGRRPGQFATIDKLRKMTGRSHEYWAEAYFERGYGENAEDGLFNVGYLFDGDDSKPTKTEMTGTFATDPDLLGAVISNDYYSYTQRQQTYSRNHTLETSFRRKWRGKHYVECNAKVRFSENSDKKQLFSEALSSAGDAERNSYYNSQLTSELYLNYGLELPVFNFHAAAIGRLYHNYLHNSDGDENKYSRNFMEDGAVLFVQYTPQPSLRSELHLSLVSRVPSAGAMNPYVDRSVAGQISYGNPRLSGEHIWSGQALLSKIMGKAYAQLTVTGAYCPNLIASYTFMQDNLRHVTVSNNAEQFYTDVNLSSNAQVSPSTYMSLWATYRYATYNTAGYKSHGSNWSTGGYISQRLPWNLSLEMSGDYTSGAILTNGKAQQTYNYSVSLHKEWCKNKLQMTLGAASFIPVYNKKVRDIYAEGFHSHEYTRSFKASYFVKLAYSLGKLQVRVKRSQHTIDNDDVKTDYDK